MSGLINRLAVLFVPANLLFISFKIVKGFFGDNFFYYLLFLAETFMMCVNVFYTTRNKISA